MVQSLVTGVDIGHHSIKAVVLKPAGDTYTLLGYKEIVVTDDIFADNHTLDYQKIVKKLKELKKGLPRFSHKVVISVPDNTVISKVLQVDSDLESREQEFAIYQAFSHQSPFPIEEVRLDFVQMVEKSSEKSASLAYQVYATKRDVIESRVVAMEKAGFVPILVEVQTHGLVHLWQMISRIQQRQDWLLIDVGYTQTTLCFDFPDKAPFLKQIPSGTQFWSAERSDDGDDVHAAVTVENASAEGVQDLVEKIARQIHMFSSVNGSQSVSGLWLSGGGADTPDLREAMAKKMNMPCEKLEPFSLFNDKARKSEPSASNLSCFSTAAGLALRGVNWLENGHAV